MSTDDLGPQKRICLACTIPLRDEHGEQLRDESGFARFNCQACVGRWADRVCECFLCPWLRDPRLAEGNP